MEYGLRHIITMNIILAIPCLNPCFNGIWSATDVFISSSMGLLGVLILVLMEYGLRQL